MEMVKFALDNVLGPVFGHDLKMIKPARHQEEVLASRRKRELKHPDEVVGRADCFGDAILDFSGPPLIEGLQSWTAFYVILGHINPPHLPLAVSIVFKLCVLSLSLYVILTHFAVQLLRNKIFAEQYVNPIFVLITCLASLVSLANMLVIFYSNLCNLSPLFKILQTPRLCFVNRQTQLAFGARTFKLVLLFFLYHTLLCRMFIHHSFSSFINEFSLPDFLLESYAMIVLAYYNVGLAHMDFYIRACFGAWLLALKSNLEFRAVRFKYLSRLVSENSNSNSNSDSDDRDEGSKARVSPAKRRRPQQRRDSLLSLFQDAYKFVSLDEVQKSLNTMDDHLEVWRSVQTYSLVLVALSAFLTSGTLLLISYNILVKSNDFYHGLILLLLSSNSAVLIAACYLGDSFVYYALSGFVRTVEDEYFQQEELEVNSKAQEAERRRSRRGEKEGAQESVVHRHRLQAVQLLVTAQQTADHNQDSQANIQLASSLDSIGPEPATLDKVSGRSSSSSLPSPSLRGPSRAPADEKLSIRKSDVIFCRELLEQFENHLATPWSKLTLKSHLSMMATFATLIAAQIIFDSDH